MTDRQKTGAKLFLQLVGGAVGLSLASRILGLVRELVIVSRVGVHDYTDAYFATSTIILWLQNWSFGAWSLYFVPKFLSLTPGERSTWFGGRIRWAVFYGCLAAVLFCVFYSPIERLMLGGRRVLGPGEVIALAIALPCTAVAGVYYARLISEGRGIFLAARGLFVANIAGFAALVALVVGSLAKSYVLPITLTATQAVTAIVLGLSARRLSAEDVPQALAVDAVSSSQALATTIENVAFNLNSVGNQAIAGWLPPGSVTMNAYATRLLLLPVSGLMAPVQQRLMQQFASAKPSDGLRTARRGSMFALCIGAAVGMLAMVALLVTMPFWPVHAQQLLRIHRFGLVVLFYGCYAGVLFSNGIMARWYFATGFGWTYAFVMTGGYTLGTSVKAVLASHMGISALALGGVIGEGLALATLLVAAQRRFREKPSLVHAPAEN